MDKSSPDYLLQNLDNVYTDSDPRTYPLSSYVYMIEPTGKYPSPETKITTAKRQSIADFSYYAICQGQRDRPDRLLAPAGQPRRGGVRSHQKLKEADPAIDLGGLEYQVHVTIRRSLPATPTRTTWQPSHHCHQHATRPEKAHAPPARRPPGRARMARRPPRRRARRQVVPAAHQEARRAIPRRRGRPALVTAADRQAVAEVPADQDRSSLPTRRSSPRRCRRTAEPTLRPSRTGRGPAPPCCSPSSFLRCSLTGFGASEGRQGNDATTDPRGRVPLGDVRPRGRVRRRGHRHGKSLPRRVLEDRLDHSRSSL